MKQTRFKITVGHKAHPGKVRTNMEDRYSFQANQTTEDVRRFGSLFVVADGVGGEQAGEVASSIAAQAIPENYYHDQTENRQAALIQAIDGANIKIQNEAAKRGLNRMATTLVSALIQEDCLVTVHLGDSRAYLFRQGQLRPLTTDHSWVEDQVRKNLMTRQEAQTSDRRSMITRCLGMSTFEPEVTQAAPLVHGDQILLCTDGLYDCVNEAAMEAVLNHHKNPQMACDELVNLALDGGGTDNITVVVAALQVEPDSSKPGGGWSPAGTAAGEASALDASYTPEQEEVWLPINPGFLENDSDLEEIIYEDDRPVEESKNVLQLLTLNETSVQQFSFLMEYEARPGGDFPGQVEQSVQLPDGRLLFAVIRAAEDSFQGKYPQKLDLKGEIAGEPAFACSLVGYGVIDEQQLWIDWAKPDNFVLYGGKQTLCLSPNTPRVLIETVLCEFAPIGEAGIKRANAMLRKLTVKVMLQFDPDQA